MAYWNPKSLQMKKLEAKSTSQVHIIEKNNSHLSIDVSELSDTRSKVFINTKTPKKTTVFFITIQCVLNRNDRLLINQFQL